jgi:hypothetical protein
MDIIVFVIKMSSLSSPYRANLNDVYDEIFSGPCVIAPDSTTRWKRCEKMQASNVTFTPDPRVTKGVMYYHYFGFVCCEVFIRDIPCNRLPIFSHTDSLLISPNHLYRQDRTPQVRVIRSIGKTAI